MPLTQRCTQLMRMRLVVPSLVYGCLDRKLAHLHVTRVQACLWARPTCSRAGANSRLVQDVADICQVKKSTIEETYAELFPELRSLVPANVRPPMAETDWAAFPTPDLKAIRKR